MNIIATYQSVHPKAGGLLHGTLSERAQFRSSASPLSRRSGDPESEFFDAARTSASDHVAHTRGSLGRLAGIIHPRVKSAPSSPAVAVRQ